MVYLDEHLNVLVEILHPLRQSLNEAECQARIPSKNYAKYKNLNTVAIRSLLQVE